MTRGVSLVAMRPDRVTIAAFIGFVLIAGAVSVAIRLGAFELPPFWAATLRYAMAVPIFAALAIAMRIPFPRGANLVGALLFSLTFVVSTALLYVGVSGSSASMGAIAFAVTPLVTLALAAAIGLERFTLPRGRGGPGRGRRHGRRRRRPARRGGPAARPAGAGRGDVLQRGHRRRDQAPATGTPHRGKRGGGPVRPADPGRTLVLRQRDLGAAEPARDLGGPRCSSSCSGPCSCSRWPCSSSGAGRRRATPTRACSSHWRASPWRRSSWASRSGSPSCSAGRSSSSASGWAPSARRRSPRRRQTRSRPSQIAPSCPVIADDGGWDRAGRERSSQV